MEIDTQYIDPISIEFFSLSAFQRAITLHKWSKTPKLPSCGIANEEYGIILYTLQYHIYNWCISDDGAEPFFMVAQRNYSDVENISSLPIGIAPANAKSASYHPSNLMCVRGPETPYVVPCLQYSVNWPLIRPWPRLQWTASTPKGKKGTTGRPSLRSITCWSRHAQGESRSAY